MTEFVYEEYPMFLVPFLILDVNNWTEKKEKLFQVYKKEKEYFEQHSMQTSYYQAISDKNKLNSDQIYEILKDEFLFFKKKYNCEGLHLKNSWFQLYKKSQEHVIHNHGALGYSFVCFLKFDSNHHKSTTFLAPFYNFLDGVELLYTPENISEGKIIFFPSVIMHFAPQNTSDVDRIILSGNLGM